MDTYENYVQEAELYNKHDREYYYYGGSSRRKGVDSDIDDRQVYTPDEIKNNIFDEAVTDMGLTLLITKKDKDKNISCDTYNKQQKINLLLKFKKKKKEVSDHYIKPALLAL